jgi:hypothetical protein
MVLVTYTLLIFWNEVAWYPQEYGYFYLYLLPTIWGEGYTWNSICTVHRNQPSFLSSLQIYLSWFFFQIFFLIVEKYI